LAVCAAQQVFAVDSPCRAWLVASGDWADLRTAGPRTALVIWRQTHGWGKLTGSIGIAQVAKRTATDAKAIQRALSGKRPGGRKDRPLKEKIGIVPVVTVPAVPAVTSNPEDREALVETARQQLQMARAAQRNWDDIPRNAGFMAWLESTVRRGLSARAS
jgi:hypothetical protein